MTTSFWSATTTFARQTGQRSDVGCSTFVVISASEGKYPLSIEIVK